MSRDERAWLHGRRLDQALPTADQILHALKQQNRTWDDGLRLAGLHPRGVSGGAAGVPAMDAVEMFIEEMGGLPNRPQLEQYARLKGFALQRRFGVRRLLDDVRASRRERGLDTPEPCPPGSLDFSRIEPLADHDGSVPKKMRGDWDYDACLDGLVKAIEKMKGSSLTQRALRALAREDPEIPHPAIVDRVAKKNGLVGLVDMRAEAARRLAETRRQ